MYLNLSHLNCVVGVWLSEQPQVNTARVIITFIEVTLPPKKRGTGPEYIAGKGKTLGDIVSSMINEKE